MPLLCLCVDSGDVLMEAQQSFGEAEPMVFMALLVLIALENCMRGFVEVLFCHAWCFNKGNETFLQTLLLC